MLHFHGGRIWHYQIGREFVNVQSPDGHRYNWRVHEIVKMHPFTIDDLRWERRFHVRPSQVKDYIYRLGLEPTPI